MAMCQCMYLAIALRLAQGSKVSTLGEYRWQIGDVIRNFHFLSIDYWCELEIMAETTVCTCHNNRACGSMQVECRKC